MRTKSEEELNYLKNIGLRVEKKRKEKGFTQIVFAEMLGTSDAQVYRIERGKVNSSILALRKMATLLGVTTEYLTKE